MWKVEFSDNTNYDSWRADLKNFQGPPPQQYSYTGFFYTWIDKA